MGELTCAAAAVAMTEIVIVMEVLANVIFEDREGVQMQVQH